VLLDDESLFDRPGLFDAAAPAFSVRPVPLTDPRVGLRGQKGAYAARDVPAFTILGPYAGELTTKAALDKQAASSSSKAERDRGDRAKDYQYGIRGFAVSHRDEEEDDDDDADEDDVDDGDDDEDDDDGDAGAADALLDASFDASTVSAAEAAAVAKALGRASFSSASSSSSSSDRGKRGNGGRGEQQTRVAFGATNSAVARRLLDPRGVIGGAAASNFALLHTKPRFFFSVLAINRGTSP
jgi:hypothetical protein